MSVIATLEIERVFYCCKDMHLFILSSAQLLIKSFPSKNVDWECSFYWADKLCVLLSVMHAELH